MSADWDAVVVGAGPAGAFTARELARRNLSVLLAERRPFPRSKVCGGCLNAHGVRILETARLDSILREAGGPRLRSLRLAAAGKELRVPLSGGAAVERGAFDQALVREAVASGVQFLPEHQVLAGPVEAGLRRLTLRSGAGERETSARVVVAADGLGSRLLDSDAPPLRGSRLGAGALIEDDGPDFESGVVHMAVGRGGYVGLVRLRDGRLNVAAAFDPALLRSAGDLPSAARRVLEFAGFPLLSGLASANWTGTPALTRRPRRPAAERLFAVGDASGYVEPFTGEGMAWALADARDVGDFVEEASKRWLPRLAEDWALRHRRRTRAARWRCHAVAWLLRRPTASRALLGVLNAQPGWSRSLAERIHGVVAEA